MGRSRDGHQYSREFKRLNYDPAKLENVVDELLDFP